MKTISSTFSGAGTDLRFKQGLVLAMLEEANRAVLAAAGYVIGPVVSESQALAANQSPYAQSRACDGEIRQRFVGRIGSPAARAAPEHVPARRHAPIITSSFSEA